MLFLKNCKNCGNSFSSNDEIKLCCSKRCSNKINLLKAHENKRIHVDVHILCETCTQSFTVKWAKRKRRFCSKSCANKFPSRIERFLKVTEGCAQDPNRNAKISAYLKTNNPSKQSSVRIKIRETLKAKNTKIKAIKNTPRYYTKNHKDTRCQWYHYRDKYGTLHYCQGGFELAFILWLDQQNINFISHPTFFTYADESGKIKRYHPDFYLKDFTTYVDVKSSFTLIKDLEKIKLIRTFNSDFKLLIITEFEMNEVGIDLRYKTLKQLRLKYLEKC